jgi:ABC-2 type transport system permease protein
MVADSATSMGWLRWFTPLGWIENIRPMRETQFVALVPIVATVVICQVLAVVLAGRRDVYASVLPASEGRRQSTWLVWGPISLALRLTLPATLGWLVAIGGYGWIVGSTVRAGVSLLSSSPAFTASLGRIGIRAATLGYLSLSMFFFEIIIAMVAASHISAYRDEESAGRLDHLLVRPVSRLVWLGGRLVVSIVIIEALGLAGGLFTWWGASSNHIYVALDTMIQAGVNSTLPALFVLGAGVLVYGVLPRLAPLATYGIVAWSFLFELLGSFIKGADWLNNSSVFTHITLAPAAKPDWGTGLAMIGIGLACAVVGALAFRLRDIQAG